MNMSPLELVNLTTLMACTSGSPEVKIGLIDGPVATQHPDLPVEQFQKTSGVYSASCTQANSAACLHGTFVAGILSAKRSSPAPAICPDCTLFVRPIFSEAALGREQMPSATPEELATAIIECIDAGVKIINLSLALMQTSAKGEQVLEEVLNQAIRNGVIVIAAAGNQGALSSSAITRHPWVIPVGACDILGRPLNESNLGNSIGRRGLMAPGDGITSLSTEGKSITLGGTSVAVPFVTGAIALLWSEFLSATAAQIKIAITQAYMPRRAAIVPPLLNANTAYQFLQTSTFGR
jgi:subtilisin family serine protease